MNLDIQFYSRHNYHNEKVVKWFAGNYEVDEDSLEESGPFGCCCSTYYKDDVTYLLDDDGNKTDKLYKVYFEIVDVEEFMDKIPDLTEEEREELLDMGILRIYLCPECENWSLDE